MVNRIAAVLVLLIIPFTGFAEFSIDAGTGCGIMENTPFLDTIFLHLIPGLSLYHLADDTLSFFLDASGYIAYFPAMTFIKGDAAVSGDISYKNDFFVLMLEVKSKYQHEINPGIDSWENILRLYVSGGDLDFTFFFNPGFKAVIGSESMYGPVCGTGISLNAWDLFIFKTALNAECLFTPDDYIIVSAAPVLSFSFYPGRCATVIIESGYTRMTYEAITDTSMLPVPYHLVNGKIDLSVSFSPKINASLFIEGSLYFYDDAFTPSGNAASWELMPEASLALLLDKNNSLILRYNALTGNNNDTSTFSIASTFTIEWEFSGK